MLSRSSSTLEPTNELAGLENIIDKSAKYRCFAICPPYTRSLKVFKAYFEGCLAYLAHSCQARDRLCRRCLDGAARALATVQEPAGNDGRPRSTDGDVRHHQPAAPRWPLVPSSRARLWSPAAADHARAAAGEAV